MKILELNLKKQWFDMILSGVKTEEYREIKPYWVKRLQSEYGTAFYGGTIGNSYSKFTDGFKHYDAIRFSNGYAKDRRQMIVALSDIKIGMGYAPWGAADELTFILKLGEILETKNC